MLGEVFFWQQHRTKGPLYMENQRLLGRIETEGRAFLEEAGKASESAYLVLLTLYVSVYYILKIAWVPDIEKVVEMVRYGILGIVVWGSAAYLFFVIAGWKELWKKNVPLILSGGFLVAATALFSAKMSTNLYGVVMDCFFCVMAFWKDFRKMLKCMLGTGLIMLFIAGAGVAAGFTMDLQKPLNVSPGHSLGINYPNTWGYLVFLVMLLAWYLFLRGKKLMTFLLFWSVSIFMYYYISCRTITGFSIVFPVCAVIADYLEKRVKERPKKSRGLSLIGRIVIILPFIAFAAMMFISMQVEWVHKHFYYTPLHNFAMRFVQGGLYFRSYGLPLVGNAYRANQITYINVNDEFQKVGILDSSFAAYIIMRGMIWMICILLWLCFVNWKALKRNDYGIPLVGAFILLFAMMERPGLEMWYNFVMLYPLAKAARKAGSVQPAAQEEDPGRKESENGPGNGSENGPESGPGNEVSGPEVME